MKRMRLFVSFGNKQENRKCLMACNNQYNECGRICFSMPSATLYCTVAAV